MQREGVRVVVDSQQDSDVRWLALTIRRGLLLICRAIEERYLTESKGRG